MADIPSHKTGQVLAFDYDGTLASAGRMAREVVNALAQLGASPHETIAVGDAENDEPLLRAAGFGVATGNALARLKAQADMVLGRDNGEGIVELVHQQLLAETVRTR